jgi:hypothetical protein
LRLLYLFGKVNFSQPQGLIMSAFTVTVRTEQYNNTFVVIADSSMAAYAAAAETTNDAPCAITVKPAGTR